MCKDHIRPGAIDDPQQLYDPEHAQPVEERICHDEVACVQQQRIDKKEGKKHIRHKGSQSEKEPQRKEQHQQRCLQEKILYAYQG